MKNLLTCLLLVLPLFAIAQQSDLGKELVAITSHGLLKNEMVEFDEASGILSIGEFLIPVSTNTRVVKKKVKSVEFLLQNYTSITSKSDASIRKAWHVMRFKSKESAQQFIDAFKKAAAVSVLGKT